MTTTPKTIAELRKLLAEATPRPWHITWRADGPVLCHEDERRWIAALPTNSDTLGTPMPHQHNAELLAAAVNALPSLLSDLEAAQKREQVLRNELLRLRDVVCQLDVEAIDAALAERSNMTTQEKHLRELLKASQKREQVLREAILRVQPLVSGKDVGNVWLNYPTKPEETPNTVLAVALAATGDK